MLLSSATIIELAIMILLIIEFLLMSRFLNNILNEEQKKLAAIKNNLTKNIQKIPNMDLNQLNEEEQLDQIIPETVTKDKNLEKQGKKYQGLNQTNPKRIKPHKPAKGIIKLRQKIGKVKHIKNKLDDHDMLLARIKDIESNQEEHFNCEEVLLDFDKVNQKVPFSVSNIDFGLKNDQRNRK